MAMKVIGIVVLVIVALAVVFVASAKVIIKDVEDYLDDRDD